MHLVSDRFIEKPLKASIIYLTGICLIGRTLADHHAANEESASGLPQSPEHTF